MQKINELQLAKELIRFPTVTPIDAGVMKFLEKNVNLTTSNQPSLRIIPLKCLHCVKNIEITMNLLKDLN